MSKKSKKRSPALAAIVSFLCTASIMVGIFMVMNSAPTLSVGEILLTSGISFGIGAISSLIVRGKAEKQAIEEARIKAEQERLAAEKKSYGPEIDGILNEGITALREMGRLYKSIEDVDIKRKINELMMVTDKITQDAIADPSDVPQIKKFINYYLPTTLKLLNAYDRMSSQGIQGDNLDKTMGSINEMLDTAIVAYKKQLDSLFENQALDIETDIHVMSTMFSREGLSSSGSDLDIKQSFENHVQTQSQP